MERQNSAMKSKADQVDVLSRSEMLPTCIWSRCSFAAQNSLPRFMQEIEDVPFRIQIGQELSDREKQPLLLWLIYAKGRLENSPSFVQHNIFSNQFTFMSQSAENMQTCSTWLSRRPETL